MIRCDPPSLGRGGTRGLHAQRNQSPRGHESVEIHLRRKRQGTPVAVRSAMSELIGVWGGSRHLVCQAQPGTVRLTPRAHAR